MRLPCSMVGLSRGGEYAVRGMIRLAGRSPGDGLMLISEIAEAEGVSASFLAKTFQKLVKAGLVESARGAAGGVGLARPTDKITLRDIVEAIDGPIELNRCLSSDSRCEKADRCALSSVWREAQEKLLEVLARTTLDRMSSDRAEEAHVPAAARAKEEGKGQPEGTDGVRS